MKRTSLRWLPVTLWALLVVILSIISNPVWFIPRHMIRSIRAVRVFSTRLDVIMWAFGHFFLYAVLAFLLAYAMALVRSPSRLRWLGAFTIVLAFGVDNEIHQSFIPTGFLSYLSHWEWLKRELGAGLISCLS